MKVSIKLKFTDTVLFEGEYESTRKAVEDAVLKKINLSGAYLRGADLRGADLRGAYLSGADLSGADLSGADLRGADLTGAYLTGAYLTGADLRGADLTGAYLTGADLRGAYLFDKKLKIAPLQLLGLRWDILTNGETVKIGCQIHKWDKWLAFTAGDISIMADGAWEWFESHKDLIGALVRRHNELEAMEESNAKVA